MVTPPAKLVVFRTRIPATVLPVIVPLLVMPPRNVVVPLELMPVRAEMVPVLVTPPENVVLARDEMPDAKAVTLPLLAMPPVNRLTRNVPSPPPPETVPLLVMPPPKEPTWLRNRARDPPERVPELVMPPVSVAVPETAMPMPTAMFGALIDPVLEIVPSKVELVMMMPTGLPGVMLPLLTALPTEFAVYCKQLMVVPVGLVKPVEPPSIQAADAGVAATLAAINAAIELVPSRNRVSAVD